MPESFWNLGSRVVFGTCRVRWVYGALETKVVMQGNRMLKRMKGPSRVRVGR